MVQTRARARQNASNSDEQEARVPRSETPQLDALVRELGAGEAIKKTRKKGAVQYVDLHALSSAICPSCRVAHPCSKQL